MRMRHALAGATLALFALCGAAQYPNQPLKLVHGFAAGGNADLVARTLADALAPALKVPVVVDARPGASGTIAAQQVAHAAADGYTLILSPSGYAFERALNPKLKLDPLKDLTMVTTVMNFPFLVFVRSESKFRSTADLLSIAQQTPGGLSFGTAGAGSAQHLTGELVSLRAGVQMLHVPYKGGAAAITGLLGGEVDFMIGTAAVVQPQLDAGKLRVLAVTTRQRWAGLPQVPTLQESGVAAIDIGAWFGVAVPSATPAAVVLRLHDALNQALLQPAVRVRLESMGGVVATSTPEQAQRRVADDLLVWQDAVRQLPASSLSTP